MKKTIILFIVLFVCGTLILLWHQYNQSQFSVDKWDENIYVREKMLDDLLNSHDLSAMCYDEIVSLLGTNGIVPNSKISYYIGKSYLGAVLFHISFDSNNRVVSYAVIAD